MFNLFDNEHFKTRFGFKVPAIKSIRLFYEQIDMTKSVIFFRFFCITMLFQVAVNYADSQAQAQAQIQIDHVVVAVSNLDSASLGFRNLGFTQKEGRLHTNGLLNRHIKFLDGTELELMTVIGEPKDEMAKGYYNFLESGEGGAFIAFQAKLVHVLEASSTIDVSAIFQEIGGFRYVTFSDQGLENIFFIEYEHLIQDSNNLLKHENGVIGIDEVWIEASSKLRRLFDVLNIKETGVVKSPTGLIGERYDNGVVIINNHLDVRPRVLGVKLKTSKSQNTILINPEDAHGIWIELINLSD